MRHHPSGLKHPLLFQGALAAIIAAYDAGQVGSEHPARDVR